MARAPNEQAQKAFEMYKKGRKLAEIAEKLNLPAGTIRRWKSTYKWDSERSDRDEKRSDRNSERSDRKKGGQRGNKNATGPPKNQNAVKHGLFAKYLPEETLDIIQATNQANHLDLLWDNIQIQYAAILRAQQIMYIKNKDELTKERRSISSGEYSESVAYDIQYAWDKQANFLVSQSRAMTTLQSMIKNYDELIHKNWDMATQEQKARIELMKSKIKDDGDNNNGMLEDLIKGLKNDK